MDVGHGVASDHDLATAGNIGHSFRNLHHLTVIPKTAEDQRRCDEAMP
jgi:hypothetical protein